MNLALATRLSLRAYAANRLRLVLTVACIALGVALAVAVHTIHTSALAEIDRAAHALAGKADVEIRGPRNGFDDRLFARVAALPEVLAASPIVEVDAPVAGTQETLRIVGLDALRAVSLQPAFLPHREATGAAQAASPLDPRNAWLSPAASARLGLARGASLRLLSAGREEAFEVAGVLPGLEDAGEIALVDIAAAQWRFGRLGVLSRIDLRLKAGVDPAEFRRALGPILPPGVVANPPASLSGRAAAITRAYRVNLDALALVALATGAFLVFATLALQAARRRSEFALLRAMGVTRRGLTAMLALEGAGVGLAGALAGTIVGLAASRALLEGLGADLGAGYFGGRTAVFAPDVAALGAIAFLAIGAATGAAVLVARSVARMRIAEALRDRALDLPAGAAHSGSWAAALALAGVPLLALPPIEGLPLGGYAAIACWLGAAVLAVRPACRFVLAHLASREMPVEALALAQVRHLPGHLSASVAGIVMSASLCVAMAIMVYSFRASLEEWLSGVVGADLYVRSSPGGDTGYFDAEAQQTVAELPQVASVEALRYDRLVFDPAAEPLSLIARPIDDRILAGFQAEPAGVGNDPGMDVWISEAARDLRGWHTGDTIVLPVAGRSITARVAGVVRDYARTWGAVLMPLEDYRRLTGDMRANDLALHLAPGVDVREAREAVSAVLGRPEGLLFEDATQLRRRSLEVFDRSFAVTYALEAIAVAIGLAGVTSSFAALAWSRRREFGLLRFLGLRRRDILRLLALEGAATGALGAAIGLAAGIAISLVLVHVVNRQSFHWTLQVHWPFAALASLVAAVIALCALGARASGAVAVRSEAVLAVKDDA